MVGYVNNVVTPKGVEHSPKSESTPKSEKATPEVASNAMSPAEAKALPQTAPKTEQANPKPVKQEVKKVELPIVHPKDEFGNDQRGAPMTPITVGDTPAVVEVKKRSGMSEQIQTTIPA